MLRILFWIVAALQVADVATTYIGSLVVEGFYEANPIVAWMTGQPPVLWKLIALKVLVLAFVWWMMKLSKGTLPFKLTMGLAALVYVAIVWNNINVIL